MTIRKQLVKRTIAGDVILVPVGDASLELKGLLTLNETGERMWDLLPSAIRKRRWYSRCWRSTRWTRPPSAPTWRSSWRSCAGWRSCKRQKRVHKAR